MGISLATIFSDGMIFQRDKKVKVWGEASPRAMITAKIQEQVVTTMADNEGGFSIELSPLQVSSKESLVVSDGEDVVTIKDVAVGEVWLAGGQSNMEFWMKYEKHIEEIRPNCKNSAIRYFEVPKRSFKNQDHYFDFSEQGIWRKANDSNIDFFSGVGYYFAAYVQKELGVPVGIISCNYGGTCAKAWMKAESVRTVGKVWYDEYLDSIKEKNMAVYWEKQCHYPGNDSGRPFLNAFNNKFLPKTYPESILMEFLANQMQDGSYDPECFFLSPFSFPGSLYENMLKTVAPFSIRGFLWYQGESDEPHANIYSIMLSQLIQDWRELWGEELPFLEVQLPGFDVWIGPHQTGYNMLRQQQEEVADAVSNVWMTSISDAGEQFDIHPKDKKKPGERLALLALGKVYGHNILCEAPRPASAAKDCNKVRIHFLNAEGGLCALGENPNNISVDADVTYSVRVEGEDIVLDFETIPEGVVTVSHAQQQFYVVNIYNQSGIPAVPFQIKAQ